MKIVRVQYTAKENFVEKNKENILLVMSDLRKMNNPGIKYSVYLMSDGCTFMHLAQYENDELQKTHNAIESFKNFTTDLKANGLESPPVVENPELVDSSFDIF